MRSTFGFISFLVFVAALRVAVPAFAQPQGLTPYQPAPPPPITGFPGMTQEQVQQIMEHSRMVQECLANEGKEPLKRIQKRNRENSKTVDALCRAGKKKEAQETAERLENELADSEDSAVIEQCRKKGLRNSQKTEAPKQKPADDETGHVCDYLK